ncbi:MAG: hypothetical protein M1816_003101 [Peltula sp. TS41687]|nr:MAG: hypothetical protein M1816_003101 [Peltula sp. TS41687]
MSGTKLAVICQRQFSRRYEKLKEWLTRIGRVFEIYRDYRLIGVANREGNRYILTKIENGEEHSALLASADTDEKRSKEYALWHKRLAHVGQRGSNAYLKRRKAWSIH